MGRHRAVSRAPISLFSFQDVITSVTGIMVFLTLMLTLELVEQLDQSPPIQTRNQIALLQGSIAELEKEAQALQNQMDASHEIISGLPTLDAQALEQSDRQLEGSSQRLRREISAISADLATKQQQRDAAQQLDAPKRKKADTQIADLQQRIKNTERRLAKIESSNRQYFTQGIRGKTTWLVEVTSTGYTAAQLGITSRPTSCTSTPAFQSWLATLSASSHAIYFIIKPGGVSRFEEGRKAAQSSGVDLGFQVIARDQTVIDPQSGADTP